MSDPVDNPAQFPDLVHPEGPGERDPGELLKEDQMSIGDWLERIRGAGMSAQQHARAGLVVPEETDWLELAAVAVRRVMTIRRNT
jgi:hypothetical protein